MAMIKKAAGLIILFFSGVAFAQAPELKGLCFHSWEKLTELNYEEYKDAVGFREDLDDGYHTFTKNCKFRLYSEKIGNYEILRLFYSPNLETLLKREYKNKILTENEYKDLVNDYVGQLIFVKSGDVIRPFIRCRFGYVNIEYPQIEFEDYYFRQREDGRILVYEVNASKCIELNKNPGGYELKYIEEQNYEDHDIWLKLMPEKIDDIYFASSIHRHYKVFEDTMFYFNYFLFDSKSPLRYSLLSAFDGKPETSYCVSQSQYKKQNGYMTFTIMNLKQQNFNPKLEKSVHEILCTKMAVINGYAENMDIYKKNNRLSSYFGCAECVIFKDDCLNYQVFNLYYSSPLCYFESKYKGSKYSDVCLAEINLYCDKLGWLFGPIGNVDHVFNNERLDLK